MIQYGTFRSLPLGCFVQNPPSLFQSPSKSCFHCCGSVAKSCVDCSTSGFPILHCLPEFAQLLSIELMMPANYLILCHPLLLLASIFPSIRVFSNESALHIRWPKYWSFSFSISPSNEYLVMIFFRIDWFDLLAVQGTLKSLLQHHSSKAPILCSAFFMVQLAHPYMNTRENHSFDYKALCWKSNVSTFLVCCLGWS